MQQVVLGLQSDHKETDDLKPLLHFLAFASGLITLITLISLSVFAQGGKASIQGVVADPQGAVVVGAKVVVLDTLKGQTRETATSAEGTYVVPLLSPSKYSVTCTHPGFKSETRSDITITAEESARVDFSLQVGDVEQNVHVSAVAEMINTTNGSLGQIVAETTIVELPLNGRNPASLVNLTSGAVDGLTTPVFIRQSTLSFPSETGASINGGRQGSVYYMLDGAYSMDDSFGLAAPFPNPDATQEFRVLSNNFGAQYGFSPGAVVSIVTRSGSNSWHGDAFEFVRNDKLNARDFFSQRRDGLKRNQFGGSVGGAIIKDKLFIFGNYQETIGHRTLNSTVGFVPNNRMLNGDFSDLLNPQFYNPVIQLKNPATGQPYPNNFIAPATFDPVAVKFEQVLPRTDSPIGQVLLPGRFDVRDYEEFTVKADWNPTQRNHLSVRSFFDNFNHPAYTGGGDILLASRGWLARYQNYSGNWVYTIRPNLLNNLVVSYSRPRSHSASGAFTSDGKPVCFPCFGSNVAMDTRYPPAITWYTNEFFLLHTFASDYNQLVSLSESINWIKGKHMFTAGIDVRRESYLDTSVFISDGLFGFDGRFTGSDLADFFLGDASEFSQSAGTNDKTWATLWGGYAQDTVRLKPNLTLNVGLRWEPFFPPTMAEGEIASFRPGQKSTRYPNAPLGLVYPGDAGVPQASGYPSEVPILEPRASVAWQPKVLPHTAVRAAFGIFAVPIREDYYQNAQQVPPFSATYDIIPSGVGGQPISLSNPWSNYAPTGFRSPFPPFASTTSAPPSTATIGTPVVLDGSTFAPNFKLGKVQSWNLSVEHEFKGDILVRVAYVGSESYHLTVPVQRNPGFYSTNPALNGQRLLYPNFDTVLDMFSWGTASYNGLQLSFEKRFSHGLQLTSNYTWSKNLDTNSGSEASWWPSVPNPFNPQSNRGISDLNFPRIFVTNGVYQTPSLSNHSKFLKGVLAEWQLSGIWRAQSGNPFSIVGGFGNDNSQSHAGADRADLTGQPLNVRQGPKSQWINKYFNPLAFRSNAPGTFGNSPRNLLQGPGTDNVDLGIMKNFPFKERYRVQFRWEMFNAFNRTEFGLPGNNPSSRGSFGRITRTSGVGAPSNPGNLEQDVTGIPARVMQVALKFYW